MAGWQDPPLTGLDFEMRVRSPEGKLVGTGRIPKPAAGQSGAVVPIRVSTPIDLKVSELYFVYQPKEGADRGTSPVALMNVRFDSR